MQGSNAEVMRYAIEKRLMERESEIWNVWLARDPGFELSSFCSFIRNRFGLAPRRELADADAVHAAFHRPVTAT